MGWLLLGLTIFGFLAFTQLGHYSFLKGLGNLLGFVAVICTGFWGLVAIAFIIQYIKRH